MNTKAGAVTSDPCIENFFYYPYLYFPSSRLKVAKADLLIVRGSTELIKDGIGKN